MLLSISPSLFTILVSSALVSGAALRGKSERSGRLASPYDSLDSRMSCLLISLLSDKPSGADLLIMSFNEILHLVICKMAFKA